MRLYLIERTDDVDYDETAGIVIRAANEDAARGAALAMDGTTFIEPEPKYTGFRADNITITEIPAEGEPGLILRDFRAG